MHLSAMKNGQLFFDAYTRNMESGVVVDVGAFNVNGSLKHVCPVKLKYIGIDMTEGPGVDVVMRDPYCIPFPDDYADIIVSSSCLEHSEMFWLLFLEIMRVLKPTGIFYLNVPSNGMFHRHPVDCWRFYPDSGRALVSWAERNKFNAYLLESFISEKDGDIWNDYVAVFLKDSIHAHLYGGRIADSRSDVENVFSCDVEELKNQRLYGQDFRDYADLQMKYNAVKPLLKQLLSVIGLRVKSCFSSLRKSDNSATV